MDSLLADLTPAPAVRAPSPSMDRPRRAVAILGLAGGVGLLTRWAFGGPLGLGFFLWTAAVLAGFALVGGREGRGQAKGAWSWAVAALFFSAWVAVRDAPALTVFNTAATLALLALAARDAVQPAKRERLFDFVSSLAETVVGVVRGSSTMTKVAFVEAVGLKQRAPGSSAAVLRGLALATPVVGLLGALLVSGDERFEHLFSSSTSSVPELLRTLTDWTAWSLASAVVAAGGYAYALRRSRLGALEEPQPKRLTVGATEVLIVLGSVVLLFAVFLGVQAAWLFSQDPSQRGTGLTYASYARRGFFELTVVAAITWGLVEQAKRRLSAPEDSGQAVAVRALGTVVLAQALVILGSAHLRLGLYDDVYGLTLMRIWAHAGIAFLGLCLVGRLATLWVGRRRSAELAFVSGLGVLAALNVMNPDALVVAANTARDPADQLVDRYYLATLSADAAPLLSDELDTGSPNGALMSWACRMHTQRPTSVASMNWARLKVVGMKLPCTVVDEQVDD